MGAATKIPTTGACELDKNAIAALFGDDGLQSSSAMISTFDPLEDNSCSGDSGGSGGSGGPPQYHPIVIITTDYGGGDPSPILTVSGGVTGGPGSANSSNTSGDNDKRILRNLWNLFSNGKTLFGGDSSTIDKWFELLIGTEIDKLTADQASILEKFLQPLQKLQDDLTWFELLVPTDSLIWGLVQLGMDEAAAESIAALSAEAINTILIGLSIVFAAVALYYFGLLAAPIVAPMIAWLENLLSGLLGWPEVEVERFLRKIGVIFP